MGQARRFDDDDDDDDDDASSDDAAEEQEDSEESETPSKVRSRTRFPVQLHQRGTGSGQRDAVASPSASASTPVSAPALPGRATEPSHTSGDMFGGGGTQRAQLLGGSTDPFGGGGAADSTGDPFGSSATFTTAGAGIADDSEAYDAAAGGGIGGGMF